MMSGGLTLGLPKKSLIIGISHSADFEQLSDQADKWAARAVDAIIADLKPVERASIYHAYLETVWIYKYEVEPILVVAHESIRLALNRKGIV